MRSSLRGLGGAVGFNYIIYAAPYCKRHGYLNDYLIDRNAAFYKHGVKEQHKRYAYELRKRFKLAQGACGYYYIFVCIYKAETAYYKLARYGDKRGYWRKQADCG